MDEKIVMIVRLNLNSHSLFLQSSVEPVMTAYKLVTIQFKWWGLQDRVENFIHSTEKRIFTNFHRQVS